jgi:hypothetical protein
MSNDKGSNVVRKRLNALATTNRYLWEQLTQLDNDEPLDFIKLPIVDAEQVVAIVKEGKKSSYFARKIEAQIEESQKSIKQLFSQFCEDVQE